MAIQYVGGRGAGRAGSTSTVNVAINSGLTGGIGAAAIAGDLVVVTVAVATQARNPSCAVTLPGTGWVNKTQQHTTSTTYDISVCTSYKIMPATPDTVVTIPSTGNIADGQGYRIMVFRGVDPANVESVTATYAASQGVNNRPDGAAITPGHAGAWIVVGGGGAAGTGTTLFTSGDLSGFVSYNGADTNDGTVGMGYYSGWSSGSWNPAVWGGGSVNAANSWGATTLALRPAAVVHDLTATGIATGAPALGTPTLGQVHALGATGITCSPVVGTPVLWSGGIDDLEASGIAVGAPTVGVPTLHQVHALLSVAIAAGAPSVGSPTLAQVHALQGPAGFGFGAPTLGVPSLAQVHGLAATGFALPAPQVGSPTMGQVHALTAQGIAAGAPVTDFPPTLGIEGEEEEWPGMSGATRAAFTRSHR
jgi:hypothetical protein